MVGVLLAIGHDDYDDDYDDDNSDDDNDDDDNCDDVKNLLALWLVYCCPLAA